VKNNTLEEAKAWHAAEYLPELGSFTCHSTKAYPYLALLGGAVSQCTCQIRQ